MKRRRWRTGERRRRGPWVVRQEVRGVDEREEEGEVEEGDGGRGLGERDLGESREAGQGVGGIFVCQVTFERPTALSDRLLRCDEAVLEAGCPRCSLSGAVSLFLHPVSPSFPPYLSFFPPLFLSSRVPSTLPSPSLHRFRRQTGGKRWQRKERKE